MGRYAIANKCIFSTDSWMTPGEYLAWVERHGFAVRMTRRWLYERMPDTIVAGLLVVLGGHQRPATTRDEMRLLRCQAGEGH